MIGKIKQHMRIFTKRSIESGRILGVCEDGNRDWITMMATICADGTWLRPLLIYCSEASAVQDTWVHAVDPAVHNVAFTASPSGWTNDELGLRWLTYFEEISRDRMSKPSDYRLLILDGHGSHMTMKFFEKCHQNRIVLAVFPPHSTHRLQPLDIGMFRPFAMAYSRLLDTWRNDRLGMCKFTKREFFTVFWPAYLQSFTKENILSAWAKSGIHPQDASRVVKVIDPSTNDSRPATAHSGSSTVSVHAYFEVKKQLRVVLRGIDDHTASLVGEFLEKYQVALSIAEHERDCLKRALNTEQNKQQRSKPLATAAFIEEHGNVMVWDPQKIVLRQAFDKQKQDAEDAKELKKQQDKARRIHKKEQREILNAQKKAFKAESRLQKGIAQDDARAEKAADKATDAAVNKQLRDKIKQGKQQKKSLSKTPQAESMPQKQHVVVVEDNGEGSSSGQSTAQKRVRRPPKWLDGFSTL